MARQTDIWNIVNRSRSSYFRFARKVAKERLDNLVKPITDKLSNLREIDSSLIDSIDDRYVKLMLTEIYYTTGRAFAKAVWGSMLKADFSDDLYLQEVVRLVDVEAAMLVKGLTETTKRKLKDIITTTLQRGLSMQDAALIIRKEINEINRARSLMIARTETIRASNLGAMRGAYMTGLNLKKEWIPTMDDRTRRTPPDEFDHLEMKDVVVGMDSPFRVSGEELDHPCDFSGSPGNTINCRCAVAFIRE